MKKRKKKPGLQVKPGRYVIAFPIEYRTSMQINNPDVVANTLAKQTFGDGTLVIGLDDEMYADGVAMLEKHCWDDGKEFDLVCPVEMQCKIDGEYKYVRICDVRKA